MDIGIDLGTTFSVIAVNGRVQLAPDYPAGDYIESCDVTIIPTPFGEPTFPSVVLEDPDKPAEYLFGSDALQRAEEGHTPVMFSKRKIGTRETILTSSGPILAKDVAGTFLRYLKQCAERALSQSVQRAVVTHPAYFDRGAVEETREAARQAGFDMSLPQQMLMEPVAAALAYTRTDKRDPLRVLTYDLGGGTFDVTYLVRNSGVLEMRAFDGDHLLGGYNFDRELLLWVRQQLELRGRAIVFDEDDLADRGRLLRLLRVAEQVKLRLANAPDDSTMVEFRARGLAQDADHKDVPINERLSRKQFETLIRPHLDRTLAGCRRALEKANVGADELDEILLVGGSTWAPWVASAVREAFPGIEPRLFSPDLCVGAGAAIHAKMTLPPIIVGNRYTLLLNVLDTSVIDVLNIAGQVVDTAGSEEPLSVELQLPDGSTTPPTGLDLKGVFLFQDTELNEPGTPNRFVLKVRDRAGLIVLEHAFNVRYAPDTTETSNVTTVLPKPLSIETFEGLVPLAEGGVPLPAKCARTFERQNDNPSISLRLFQERDAIGEVRIENIPPEGGRGSFVDLTVEITENNQVRGIARVRAGDGQVLIETPVRVQFKMPDVPSVEALFETLRDLRNRFPDHFNDNSERNPDHVLSATLIAEIDRLFMQQPLERQEVHAAIRRLSALLNPPEDDMDPSLAIFRRALEGCRKSLGELERRTQEALAAVQQEKEASALDPGILANARKTLSRVEQYRALLEKYEHEGSEAHQRRNHKSWARIYEALKLVEVQLRERRNIEAPPTIVLKLLANLEVMRQLSELDAEADRLGATGRIADWTGEIDRIRSGFHEVIRLIEQVDDALPNDQGRAYIARIFSRSIQPLKEAIIRIGVDVSRAVN